MVGGGGGGGEERGKGVNTATKIRLQIFCAYYCLLMKMIQLIFGDKIAGMHSST